MTLAKYEYGLVSSIGLHTLRQGTAAELRADAGRWGFKPVEVNAAMRRARAHRAEAKSTPVEGMSLIVSSLS